MTNDLPLSCEPNGMLSDSVAVVSWLDGSRKRRLACVIWTKSGSGQSTYLFYFFNLCNLRNQCKLAGAKSLSLWTKTGLRMKLSALPENAIGDDVDRDRLSGS
jgi:hypothetical protein